MEIEQVAANLEKHEAICAERWKTIFNKIESMEKGAGDRFNGIEEQVSRVENILLGSAGFLIVTLAGIVISMVTIHQEKIMEMEYSKKDISKSPKVKAVLPEGYELYKKEDYGIQSVMDNMKFLYQKRKHING